MTSLNPAQLAAIDYQQGPLLVLAGAGSGKTRVITEKIARLVASGLAPNRIAAITFTNKAAREMRLRATGLLRSQDAEGLIVSTFHSLGLRMLQIEHAAVGLRRGFTIFDADDSAALIKDLAPTGTKPDTLAVLHGLVGRWKNQGLDPDQASAAIKTARESEAASLYMAYQNRLAKFNAVDFDDLIRLPLDLLTRNEELRHAWRERLRYLLVDEYQDTNAAQYQLLRLLAGPRGAFTAVGDDDQSIYAWRGAQPENINLLARDYPALKVIKLEQNYRCTGRILRAANQVIGNNPHLHPKKLWCTHGDGETIRVLECPDAEAEAERVVASIMHRQFKDNARWNHFAVLYRGNHQARAMEKALRAAGVSYQLSGGTSFFDRSEVKDVLSYLRLLVNPEDDSAFLRVVNTPRREIGSTTLERLATLAGSKNLSLLRASSSPALQQMLPARAAASLDQFAAMISELARLGQANDASVVVGQLLQRIGYANWVQQQNRDPALAERRWQNVEELLEWIAQMQRGSNGLQQLSAQLALITSMDRDDDSANQVRLMTLHAAKGLEFPHVYLIGCEEGMLPHQGALDEGMLEEERRLMYVGITRAQSTLTLSYAARRQRYGETLRCAPSRFLSELPVEDLHWSGRDSERDQAHSREMAQTHLSRLKALLDS